MLLVQAIIFMVIFQKAGYSGWLGLLMVMPLVNLAILAWFASATWPLELGYAGQGERKISDVAWETKMALRKAAYLEKQGQVAEAVQVLEAVLSMAGKLIPATLYYRNVSESCARDSRVEKDCQARSCSICPHNF
ncbi:MAG TPA: hypothetical protein PKD72_10905 [Gemmatales bacterium]|nr:hypothetical protein [Gemmatales bacterium]